MLVGRAHAMRVIRGIGLAASLASRLASPQQPRQTTHQAQPLPPQPPTLFYLQCQSSSTEEPLIGKSTCVTLEPAIPSRRCLGPAHPFVIFRLGKGREAIGADRATSDCARGATFRRRMAQNWLRTRGNPLKYLPKWRSGRP